MSNQHAPAILIVDDSAMTRAMIKRIIGMTSLSVGPLLDAGDGKAALALMESTPVDLVLADLNMPIMDGFAMIAAMRQRRALRSIPVVVISAQPDPDKIEELKRFGVMGYIAKPFTPEGISSLIGPLLDSAKQIEPPEAQGRGSFNLTLAEALVEALETMAFVSPQMPQDRALPRPSPDLRLVRVVFNGQGVLGELSLAAPSAFGKMVADNCAADALHESDDALKELANITCGLLLRKRLGGGAGFRMAPPVIGSCDEIESWINGDDAIAVDADGHLVAAHVTTDGLVVAAGEFEQ
jgi:two-component system, chemotaxis family, chemotaxis protein CheY